MPIAAVEALKADLTDQPLNPLRPHQIQEFNDEIARLGGQVAGRDIDGQPQPWLQQAKGSSSKRIREIREMVAREAPKRIDGERANRVKRGVEEVLRSVIQPALLPRAVMRRNPAGAVGHVLRTEFSREWKDAALTVKRGLRALDPDNADPDFTNMERFRAEGTNPDGTSTFMADAQVPGVFAMTPWAKDNWPLGPATADTALAQVVRREAAEAPASPKARRGKRAKRAVSAETRKKLSEQSRARWAERRQGQGGAA